MTGIERYSNKEVSLVVIQFLLLFDRDRSFFPRYIRLAACVLRLGEYND
jgi:hypothetical protein